MRFCIVRAYTSRKRTHTSLFTRSIRGCISRLPRVWLLRKLLLPSRIYWHCLWRLHFLRPVDHTSDVSYCKAVAHSQRSSVDLVVTYAKAWLPPFPPRKKKTRISSRPLGETSEHRPDEMWERTIHNGTHSHRSCSCRFEVAEFLLRRRAPACNLGIMRQRNIGRHRLLRVYRVRICTVT